jgi:hypothetical protein
VRPKRLNSAVSVKIDGNLRFKSIDHFVVRKTYATDFTACGAFNPKFERACRKYVGKVEMRSPKNYRAARIIGGVKFKDNRYLAYMS